MNQKYQYFWHKKNLLSFIAVFFVVAIHNSATNQYHVPTDFFTQTTWFVRNFFAYGLGAIAVPFFFFLSGLTFFRDYSTRKYPQKLKRRVKTLLIPYLLWNIIGLIFSILYTYTPLSNIVQGRELFTPTIGNILKGVFLYKYNYQFWFLFNLIIFTLFAPIINLIITKKISGIIFGALILCLPMIGGNFLYINLNFIIFYYLGCYFGKHHFKALSSRSNPKTIIITMLLSLSFLIIRMLTIYQIITPHIIINQLVLVLLLICTWYSSDFFIAKIKSHKYQTESFPIYTIHTYFITIIVKITYLLLPKTSWMLLINEISGTILTFCLATLITYFWHKKLPKTHLFCFGH